MIKNKNSIYPLLLYISIVLKKGVNFNYVKKNENLRENNNNMTQEMIDILKNISDLCYKASNEVYEDDD
jgi:hypothetical protein